MIDKNELITRFGEDEINELVDGLADEIADLRIDAVIGDAEAVVNSYLSTRNYSAEALAGSSLVKDFVADVARYKLYDDSPSNISEQRYDQAIAMLKDIAAGKANLAGASDEDQANSESRSGSQNGIHVSVVESRIPWGAY